MPSAAAIFSIGTSGCERRKLFDDRGKSVHLFVTHGLFDALVEFSKSLFIDIAIGWQIHRLDALPGRIFDATKFKNALSGLRRGSLDLLGLLDRFDQCDAHRLHVVREVVVEDVADALNI